MDHTNVNRGNVIQLIALARLGRHERLQQMASELSAQELACALARLPDQDQMDLLQTMDETTRQATLLALDFADWIRLVDNAGPFNSHLIGSVKHNEIRARE